MNWAWGQKLAPTPKLILMALADSANDSDECWPGISFIADKCCVSQRTVQRVLQQFENTGLMVVTPRYTSAGRQTSNGYRLRVDGTSNPDKLSPHSQAIPEKGDKLSGTGVTSDVTDEGDTATSPLEPPDYSEQQPLHFPSQLLEAEKQTARRMVNAMAPTDAQALLDELADALDCKTIKTNPLRWFHALVGKHKAGNFFPVGGVRVAERRKNQKLTQQELANSQSLPPRAPDRNLAREALAQVRRTIGMPQASAEVGKSRNRERVHASDSQE